MDSMTILPRTRSAQAGQASLETVLTLPVIFFFLMLIFQCIKASWLWLDRVIEARNAAWQTELYFGSDASTSGVLAGAQVLADPSARYAALTEGNIRSVKDKNTVGYSVATEADAGGSGSTSLQIAEKWLTDVRNISNDAPNVNNLKMKMLTESLDSDKPTGITGMAYSPVQRIGFRQTLSEQAQSALAATVLSLASGGDFKEALASAPGTFVRKEQHMTDFSQGWRIDPVAEETEGFDAKLKLQLGDESTFLEHIK